MSAAWLPLFVAALGESPNKSDRRRLPPNERPIQVIYEARLKTRRLQVLMEYDRQKDVPPLLEKQGYLMLPVRYRGRSVVTGEWDSWWDEISSAPPSGRFGFNPSYQIRQVFADRLKEQQELP